MSLINNDDTAGREGEGEEREEAEGGGGEQVGGGEGRGGEESEVGEREANLDFGNSCRNSTTIERE